MKRNLLFAVISINLMAVFFMGLTCVKAQAPQAFKYQVVARNSSGEPIMNQSVSFRISIIKDSPGGTIIYQESHLTTTSNWGVANLDIGTGTVLTGTFNEINWAAGEMFMKVEFDPEAGSAWLDMGTSALRSVPYSLQAKTAESIPNIWALTETNDMYSRNTGNVGIGTNAPSSKLEVEGGLKLKEGVEVNMFSPDLKFEGKSDAVVPTVSAMQNYIMGGAWTGGPWLDNPELLNYTTMIHPSQVFVQDNFAYVISSNSGFSIYDVSDPANVLPKSGLFFYQQYLGYIVVEGSYAYVSFPLSNEVRIFDISDPSHVTQKAATSLFHGVNLAIQGNYGYAVGANDGILRICDIRNPDSLMAKGYVDTGLSENCYIFVKGNYAYVLSGGPLSNAPDRLTIFDVSNPDNPFARGYTEENLADPTCVFVDGNKAYVTSSANNRLCIFDISDPDNIIAGDYTSTNLSYPQSVMVQGDFAYVASKDNDRLCVFDISNSSIGVKGFTGDELDGPTSVFVSDQTAFVTSYENDRLCTYNIYARAIGFDLNGNLRAIAPPLEQWQKDGGVNLFNKNIGNVGIGTNTPLSKLGVSGGLSIGNEYCGSFASPENGAIIQGKVGIGTNTTKGVLDISEYHGGTIGSAVASLSHQLVMGGGWNSGPNLDGVKLWIGDYNNDGSVVYPIYVEDENNLVDFYIRNRSNENSQPLIYIGGITGIGATNPASTKLQLEGTGTFDGIIRMVNTGTNGASFFMGSNSDNWSMGGNRFVMGHGTPNSTNVDISIESNGYLGLGLGSSAATQVLDVNGNARFRVVPTQTPIYSLGMTSNGTLCSMGGSDERLKTNIEPLSGGLDKVMNLQGVQFNWKDDAQGKKMIGFIAQEVDKVVPELVFTNPFDGYMGINYAEMTSVLVEAIKEQQKIIEKQNKELLSIRAEIDQLKALMELK